MASIPLVDLRAQHAEIRDTLQPRLDRILERCDFILGAEVAEFEVEFAAFSDATHCVAVANGTDALELALRSVGVGPGDEVIVPANTFIATALAVVRAGATPVLVDCDPSYGLLDPARAIAAITSRTRAVVPVHLYGQLSHSDDLTALAAAKGIAVVADAAQAQGARRNGRGIGAWTLISATSFYPGKNLGAYGDAGAVLTQSPAMAERVKALHNYGSLTKYHHPELGFNSRLDTLQAVVLLEKLKRLEAWNSARRRAATLYSDLLSDLPDVTLPQTAPGNEHVYHLYVVRVPNRDAVLKKLHDAGIGAGVHYPIPIHLQGAFSFLDHQPGDFPIAEEQAATALSLPLYPHISTDQQAAVVNALRAALAS